MAVEAQIRERWRINFAACAENVAKTERRILYMIIFFIAVLVYSFLLFNNLFFNSKTPLGITWVQNTFVIISSKKSHVKCYCYSIPQGFAAPLPDSTHIMGHEKVVFSRSLLLKCYVKGYWINLANHRVNNILRLI
jgi:hypothetical protein